jgi:hypothetical protein
MYLHINPSPSNYILNYVMRYNRLNVRYDYAFDQVYKTAKCYFGIMYDNESLFCDNLIKNIPVCKINVNSVVRYASDEFNVV